MTPAAADKCSHCSEELVSIPGMGHVHMNGARVATRQTATGDLVDDHVALPVRDHPAIRRRWPG